MPDGLFLSLVPGANLVTDAPDECAVVCGEKRISFPKLNSFVVEAMREISLGADEDDLSGRILDSAGLECLSDVYAVIAQLSAEGLLCQAAWYNQAQIAACIPLSRAFEFVPKAIHPETHYVLSRFALCRRERNFLVLESPRTSCRVVLCDLRTAGMLGQFAVPRRVAELTLDPSDLPARTLELVAGLLYSAGFLVTYSGAQSEEDANPVLEQWEFHDLFFHSRSRSGRHSNPYGAALSFQNRAAALSAVKSPMSAELIDLDRPDMDRLKEEDKPLTDVLETRRSVRNHQSSPMTICQLGEFLYRSARVKAVVDEEGLETTRRVYPSGGSAYPLELYAVVDRCEGLPSGLYQYCPGTHQLCRISGRTSEVDFLLASAAKTARSTLPQILLVISARFPRVSWKYSSTGYALILKDVGVLFQTMYLVATSMGLAPCALGGGNSDVFASATGLDYFSEGAVGEFMLGS